MNSKQLKKDLDLLIKYSLGVYFLNFRKKGIDRNFSVCAHYGMTDGFLHEMDCGNYINVEWSKTEIKVLKRIKTLKKHHKDFYVVPASGSSSISTIIND